MKFYLLPHSFLNSNSNSNRSTYHRVVTHTQESHHFYVSRNGWRTSELSVTVHTAHCVRHTIRFLLYNSFWKLCFVCKMLLNSNISIIKRTPFLLLFPFYHEWLWISYNHFISYTLSDLHKPLINKLVNCLYYNIIPFKEEK